MTVTMIHQLPWTRLSCRKKAPEGGGHAARPDVTHLPQRAFFALHMYAAYAVVAVHFAESAYASLYMMRVPLWFGKLPLARPESQCCPIRYHRIILAVVVCQSVPEFCFSSP